MTKYITDSPTYEGEDSGCPEATKYLGYQSSCLHCPFFPKKCIYEPGGKRHWSKDMRNEEMRRLLRGKIKTIAELASIYGLKETTVRKIVGDYISD